MLTMYYCISNYIPKFTTFRFDFLRLLFTILLFLLDKSVDCISSSSCKLIVLPSFFPSLMLIVLVFNQAKISLKSPGPFISALALA